MSSANQSTLAQAMGMGNSLESMNRVVCRTGTPWASSPALSKTMDTGSGPQARLFDSPVAGCLTGRRAALGVGGAVAPAADKSLRARQAANTEGPADSSRAFSLSPGNYPVNSPKDN